VEIIDRKNCEDKKLEPPATFPKRFSMNQKDVEFQSGNITLRGELYLPEGSSLPAITVCHGMHGQGFRWLPLYRSFAQLAVQRGFACLLFDFRGCGLSEGAFDYGWGEQEDAKAAIQFLARQEQVDASRSFVVGRSLGGTIALSALVQDPRVKGFALWATPPDHYRNIKAFIEKENGRLVFLLFLIFSTIDGVCDVARLMKVKLWGLSLRPSYVRRKLMSLNGARLLAGKGHPPILLLIGDQDDYVTLDEARRYDNSISERKRLIILPGTGHTFKGEEERVASLTLDWFQELLAFPLSGGQGAPSKGS